ncbi:MAG: hypothetical protein KGJ62_08910 [Armatimonadetes bacterium]|nr:hypothetical protein [Armatimonadota bacterium]MDE2206461.1 hypothetical protein [Armatimonadota bacterium]
MGKSISRLELLHINLIGAGAALLLTLILFFALIRPKQEATTAMRADVASVEGSGGTAAAVQSKQSDLANTKKQAVQTNADWQVSSRLLMPGVPYGTTDQILATYENWLIKVPAQWGTWLTSWYDAQRADGITRNPGVEFAIPSYSTDPNTLATLTDLTFPPGGKGWNVSLTAKTFDDAMRHLMRFNGMRRHGMPVIDNVSLTGQSPNLQLSYTLNIYVIPGSVPPAPDPMLGGALASSSGGGGGAPGPGGSPFGNGGPPGPGGQPLSGFGGPGGRGKNSSAGMMK